MSCGSTSSTQGPATKILTSVSRNSISPRLELLQFESHLRMTAPVPCLATDREGMTLNMLCAHCQYLFLFAFLWRRNNFYKAHFLHRTQNYGTALMTLQLCLMGKTQLRQGQRASQRNVSSVIPRTTALRCRDHPFCWLQAQKHSIPAHDLQQHKQTVSRRLVSLIFLSSFLYRTPGTLSCTAPSTTPQFSNCPQHLTW